LSTSSTSEVTRELATPRRVVPLHLQRRTVAGVLVAATGDGLRVVEIITVGRIEPPARRARPRRIADDFGDLARQAERRRLEQLIRLREELGCRS
jgi:hypothetical protein